MRFELPDCRRCCFCVPLRYGILTFGYLNLAFSLLHLGLDAWLDYGASITSNNMALYRGVNFFTQIWFPYILYSLEVIFDVVLLVGAHMKRTRLIKLYYYYGIMTTVAVCLTFLVVRYENQYRAFYFDPVEFFLAFAGFVLQAYLLLLIRTELQKPKYQQGQFSYVNHMSEVVLEPPVFSDGRNPL